MLKSMLYSTFTTASIFLRCFAVFSYVFLVTRRRNLISNEFIFVKLILIKTQLNVKWSLFGYIFVKVSWILI